MNVWEVAKPIERLIRSREVVDIDALRDPSIPLEALIGVAEPVGLEKPISCSAEQ